MLTGGLRCEWVAFAKKIEPGGFHVCAMAQERGLSYCQTDRLSPMMPG